MPEMNPRHLTVALRANHRCEYYRAPEVIYNFPFELDHVIPQSREGPDEVDNLALACRSCNIFKSNHVTGVDTSTDSVVPLFNPRTDVWEDHLSVATDNITLKGLTPTGRATISILRMNRDIQLRARARWVRLGIFP